MHFACISLTPPFAYALSGLKLKVCFANFLRQGCLRKSARSYPVGAVSFDVAFYLPWAPTQFAKAELI